MSYISVTTGIVLMSVIKKNIPTLLLFLSGIFATTSAIAFATENNAFKFWIFLVIGVIMMSPSIHEFRVNRKAAKEKRAKNA